MHSGSQSDDWSLSHGLAGKGVLVTGAAGGIGREIVRAFAATGARVALVDLDAGGAEAAKAGLAGGPHLAVGHDLRRIGSLSALIDDIESSIGPLDVLVNAAGVLVRRNDLNEVTEADWDLQHDVNLKATFFLSRALANRLLARGSGGRIICFTSQSWWTGSFSASVVYAATKGGIVSMVRGLARSYAKNGITVNAVAPGAIDTEMMRSGLTEPQLDAMVAQIPIGRMGVPGDVAGATVFLASDHACYITGAVINVSGGWLMY